jgi:hypothetical protein
MENERWAIPLRSAQLCLDCSAITSTVWATCTCGSHTTMPLAAILNRESAPELPPFETFDERNQEEPGRSL